MRSLWSIVLIVVIVTIDNALLAGLLLPPTTSDKKRKLLVWIGVLLGLSQILLASSVDYMLSNIIFRLLAIGLLGWMCVRTLGIQSKRGFSIWATVAKLWLYTAAGNIDNMIWLGSELRGERFWLIVSSGAMVPLFVVVALYLSNQAEKQQWILPLGAGMMAWAAAALTLDIPAVKGLIDGAEEASRTTIQCLMTVALVLCVLGFRRLFKMVRTTPS